MTQRTTPPFRADHVGSFLRPKYLLDAREEFFVKKTISAAQLLGIDLLLDEELVACVEQVFRAQEAADMVGAEGR